MPECPPGPKDPTLYPRGPGGEVIRPCMACKDTREARNNCVMEKVVKDNNSVNIISILQGAMACADLIEAHNQCMKEHGFKTPKYQAWEFLFNIYILMSANVLIDIAFPRPRRRY